MSGNLYLNGATLMTTPTPRLLEIARAAGYRGIEARAERLLVDPEEVSATRDAVDAGDVWSLNGLRLSLRSDGSMDRQTVEADLAPRLGICRDLRAAYLLAVPPRLEGVPSARAIAGARQALEVAEDRAATVGVAVAFEFLGFADCPINTPLLAAETVDGLDGIELVLDSCHWHASASPALDRFPVDRLAMVHLNDAPAKPPAEIEDADRVLPGEGVIRLADLVRDLRRHDYRGPWSLETFNPAYWSDDAGDVARRARTAMERVLFGGS